MDRRMELNNYFKSLCVVFGGIAGWFVGEFENMFPLDIITVILIIYDAYTAYRLDKRVKMMYPDKTTRKQAKFTSFAFGKVIRSTIPKRLLLILLAFAVEKWVFKHTIPLSYIVTGAICFEQAVSILENESSCRTDEDSRLWRTLKRILIDKTERHLDIELPEYKKGDKVTEEQIRIARDLLARYEQKQKGGKNESTN